jgi:carboxypeptidase Q
LERTVLKVITALLVFVSTFSTAQSDPIPKSEVEQVVGAAISRGGAMTFLETLSDRVGGRVTGSPESTAAATLILQSLRDAGLKNAHFEEVPIAVGWRRGPANASVVSPVKRPILIGSYGWAPGTGRAVQAPLVEASISSSGTFDVAPEKLKGAAVLLNIETGTNTYATSYVVLRSKAIHFLAEVGAVAMLIPSDKPHRMLYTSAYLIYPRADLPVLSVAKEDVLFLRRLMRKDEVKLQIEVQNEFVSSPGKERNVVAEIPGTGEEIVVVGGHFDSWDPAQGANDNGSGVAAALDAARILQSMAVKPKATLRFVFFTGEEQGCLGSRAYLEAHKAELGRHRLFIFMDGGAQTPVGVSVKGRKDLVQPMMQLIEPLKAVGANRVILDSEIGSDDEAFLALGIPAVELITDPGEYDINHHAITDTLDKVDPRALASDTAAITLIAIAVANADKAPGQRLEGQALVDHLARAGVLEEIKMMYGDSWFSK